MGSSRCRVPVKRGLTFLLSAVFVLGAPASGQHRTDRWRLEAGLQFGGLLAGKDIARGINRTGGEALIGGLNHGAVVGTRFGVHGPIAGVEANLLTTTNSVQVRNELGERFPNHGERPFIYSADALFYPFMDSLKSGRVRPYLTAGIGGMLFSADLDNINGQEIHNRWMWKAGGGIKLMITGEGQSSFVDFGFRNHRLSSTGKPIDLRGITLSIGYRF